VITGDPGHVLGTLDGLGDVYRNRRGRMAAERRRRAA